MKTQWAMRVIAAHNGRVMFEDLVDAVALRRYIDAMNRNNLTAIAVIAWPVRY